jgi:hypothetical protein
MLGLEPIGSHLVVDPAIPASISTLSVLDIPGRWGSGYAFARGGANVGDSTEFLARFLA